MKIEIKHRYKNEVIYSCDEDSLKSAVERAVREGADLRYADLRDAERHS